MREDGALLEDSESEDDADLVELGDDAVRALTSIKLKVRGTAERSER